MYKILVKTSEAAEKALLEEILYDFVKAGGEIFFASTKQQALEIVEKEQPQLLFWEPLAGEEKELIRIKNSSHIIFISDEEKQSSGDFLKRPLRPEVVLEKCYAIFDLSQFQESSLPL